jgi:hypothetical protein
MLAYHSCLKGKCGAEGGGMRRAAKISPWLRRAACENSNSFSRFCSPSPQPRQHFSGRDCGRLLSIYFWCRRVATSQSLLSYPSSANQLPHTIQHPFNPSLHLSTSSNATFPALLSASGFPSPLFFFPFPFLCSAYLLYTGVLYVLR